MLKGKNPPQYSLTPVGNCLAEQIVAKYPELRDEEKPNSKAKNNQRAPVPALVIPTANDKNEERIIDLALDGDDPQPSAQLIDQNEMLSTLRFLTFFITVVLLLDNRKVCKQDLSDIFQGLLDQVQKTKHSNVPF